MAILLVLPVLVAAPLDLFVYFQRLTEVLDKPSMGSTCPSLEKNLCSQPAFVKQSLAQMLVTFEEIGLDPWPWIPVDFLSSSYFPKPLSLIANTDSPWNTYTCRRLKRAKD